ncbi:MAG: hypothetical protein M5U23_09400 [Acidimicrobiia bacterium]|nr:hypothetical protein [Acidimicrobiia bacterium]
MNDPDLSVSITSTPLIAFESLALASLVCLGLLVPNSPKTSPLAIIATLLCVAAAFTPRWRLLGASAKPIAITAVFISVLLAVWGVSVYGESVTYIVLVVVSIISVSLIVSVSRGQRSRMVNRGGRLLLCTALTGLIVVMGLLIVDEPREPIDVLEIHRSAAIELANGRNPYVTARAIDTSPLARPGDVFEGYVYPPTAMMAYVSAQWSFGDPRWATVVAAACFVTLIVSPWSKMDTEAASARIALALVFVAMPPLGVMISGGWTDLLALPLFLGAAMLWKTRWLASALLLGLALSTKSYFVLALPVLLLWPDKGRWRRIWVIGAAVFTTYLPFLILDAPSILSTINGKTFEAPYRPDSLGLAGMGLNVPRWLSYSLAVITGILVGRRGGAVYRFFIGLSAVFAVVFVTGFQAFINYWVLVVGLILIALVISISQPHANPRSEAQIA